MKKTIRLFLIAGLALLAFSCQKADKYSGQEIRFTASAEPMTKTAYASSESGDIYWAENDQILIWSNFAVKRYNANQHYSVYEIVDVDGNKAKLDNPASDPNGLVYVEEKTGETDYNFWAIYPATAPVETPTSHLVSFKIDAAQGLAEGVSAVPDDSGNVTLPADMSKAVMVASDLGNPWEAYHDYTKTISLVFRPLFTAYEITLTSADDEELEITSVELFQEDDPDDPFDGLTGIVQYEFRGDVILSGANGHSIIFTFPEGTKLVKNKTLSFTLIAFPRTVENVGLKITLGDGQVRTALFTETDPRTGVVKPIKFEGTKKHRLYGLAVPGGFKMFTTEEELRVAELQEQNSDINF